MRYLVLLLLLCGCALSEKELELQRGNCHPCPGINGESGYCCEHPINAEKLCL